MSQGLSYTEQRPSASLTEHVACFWQIQGTLAPGAAITHSVLPDACVDLLFDLEALRSSGRAAVGEWVGTMTRALNVEFTGRVDLFGVRFKPGGAAAWLHLPVHPLTDTSAPADSLLGTRVRSLGEQLGAQARLGARSAIVERYLLEGTLPGAVDQLAAFVIQRIEADIDGTPIARLAAETGFSTRQIERRFMAATGLPPAAYRRVCRFRRLIALGEESLRASLAQAALEAGYYDQAHMTREFERIAGAAPGRWLALRTDVGFVQEGRHGSD